jgi:hypothetical protein
VSPKDRDELEGNDVTLHFRTVTLLFPLGSFVPGQGQVRLYRTVTFSGHVRAAQTSLKSFDIQYGRSDHHLRQLEVDVDSGVSEHAVTVSADLHLRDSSGNIDDPFGGKVKIAVLVDVDPEP